MTSDTLEPEPSKSKQESQSRSPSSSPDSFEQVEPDKSPARESSPSSPDGEVESDPKSPSSLLGTDDSSSSPCPTLDLHETALTGDTLEPEPSKSKLESDSRSPSSSSDSFERVEPAKSPTRESSGRPKEKFCHSAESRKRTFQRDSFLRKYRKNRKRVFRQKWHLSAEIGSFCRSRALWNEEFCIK